MMCQSHRNFSMARARDRRSRSSSFTGDSDHCDDDMPGIISAAAVGADVAPPKPEVDALLEFWREKL